MPYIDKKHSIALLLLGFGEIDARKYANDKEIKEAKRLLEELGWKYGHCDTCGQYWFLKWTNYQIREKRSKTWLSFRKMLCPKCRGKIIRKAAKTVLMRVSNEKQKTL